MPFKIIHQFIGKEGVLREIKWFDDTKNISGEQWQWFPFGMEPVDLTYKISKPNNRFFEEGLLSLNHVGCAFTYDGKTYQLVRLK